jgi:atypical dual specificity phosphatase
MRGLSFVQDTLAGLARPRVEDLPFLVEQKIAVLISLTTIPPDPAAVLAAGIEPVHLPIEDFCAPTYEQQVTFVQTVARAREQGLRVGVHCAAGLGRTGTMLATWLVAEGLPAEQAIAQIRRLRPGSIETAEQEAAVEGFAERVNRSDSRSDPR